MWDICDQGGQRKYRGWEIEVNSAIERFLDNDLWNDYTAVFQLIVCSRSRLSFSLNRVNDWLLKINDVDLTNKDRKQVIKAVVNGGGLINMVVRRRKSLGGRLVTPVHINLIGHKGITYFRNFAHLHQDD